MVTLSATASTDDAVDLVVSSGTALIDIPDVTGLTQTEAEGNLVAAGLTVGAVTTQSSETVEAGRVISQSPSTCLACASSDDAVDLGEHDRHDSVVAPSSEVLGGEPEQLVVVRVARHPQVAHVLGKIGRAETATDPAPLSMIETTIVLKDPSEWRPGLTKDDLIAELDRGVPGLDDREQLVRRHHGAFLDLEFLQDPGDG